MVKDGILYVPVKVRRGKKSGLSTLSPAPDDGEQFFLTDTKETVFFSEGDFVEPIAASSKKLETPINLGISGDGTAPNVSFDGSNNVVLAFTLKSTGVTAGTHTKVTVDAKGRVTAGGSVTKADIGLGNVTNNAQATKSEFDAYVIVTDAKLDEIESIAKGAGLALVFDTLSQLNQWISGTYTRPDGVTVSEIKVGTQLLIKETDVPDYWWDGSAKQELETGKIDLSDYPTTVQMNSAINAAKVELNAAIDGKENKLSASTAENYLNGTKTWTNFAASVRNAVLTGLSTAVNTAISATDTVLAALGKLQGQINKINTEKANLASPTFTGTPTAPTPAPADNSKKIATTEYVKNQDFISKDDIIAIDCGTF